MTFCMAFDCGDKGGVTIVSDKRISYENGFDGSVPINDDVQKVLMLPSGVGLTFAGDLTLIRDCVMLSQAFRCSSPKYRLEEFRRHIFNTYRMLLSLRTELKNPVLKAEFIAFDCYKKRGHPRYRVLHILLQWDQDNNRAILGSSFAKKWKIKTIGSTDLIQRRLRQAAAENMAEFRSRRGSIRKATREEEAEFSKQGIHSETGEMLMIDTSLGKEGMPMWKLFSIAHLSDYKHLQNLHYAWQLGLCAVAAIEDEVRICKETGVTGVEGISSKFHLSTYTMQFGLQTNEVSGP